MTKTQINNEIKSIYETNGFDIEQTLTECLQKGLVKSKKQLIGKLVYLKVYQKQEKAVEVKKEPTKKEIIHNLELITGLSLFDLIEAKKEGLLLLLDYVKDLEQRYKSLEHKYKALEVDYTESQEMIEQLNDEIESEE